MNDSLIHPFIDALRRVKKDMLLTPNHISKDTEDAVLRAVDEARLLSINHERETIKGHAITDIFGRMIAWVKEFDDIKTETEIAAPRPDRGNLVTITAEATDRSFGVSARAYTKDTHSRLCVTPLSLTISNSSDDTEFTESFHKAQEKHGK